MKEIKFKTLDHLENSLPSEIKGYSLTFYSIALEAWRRGLTVTFINRVSKRDQTIRYRISSKERAYTFSGSRNRELAEQGRKIAMDKQKTKDFLLKSNVPTPLGKSFTRESSKQEIIQYADHIGFPVVIKPVTGQGGQGVIANIQSVHELEKAIIYLTNQLGEHNLLVEKYFKGEDYRVMVVGNEAVAITKRYPANILGDGEHTVYELIKIKNELRKNHPMLSSSQIKIDEELQDMLAKQNYTLSSIPNKEELVLLKSKNNISSGGDPVDITDEVSDNIKKIAIDALNSIPGLMSGGVDLMVNESKDTAVVLEINTQASIRSHLYPVYGEPRDVPKKLIDLYFPESQREARNDKMYFQFSIIRSNFQKGIINEYTLPKIPRNLITSKKLTINLDAPDTKYIRWIRKNACLLNIHGYINVKDTTVEIIAMGEEDNYEKFKTIILTDFFKENQIRNYKEDLHTDTIKSGFKINNTNANVEFKKKESSVDRKSNRYNESKLIKRIKDKILCLRE